MLPVEDKAEHAAYGEHQRGRAPIAQRAVQKLAADHADGGVQPADDKKDQQAPVPEETGTVRKQAHLNDSTSLRNGRFGLVRKSAATDAIS